MGIDWVLDYTEQLLQILLNVLRYCGSAEKK